MKTTSFALLFSFLSSLALLTAAEPDFDRLESIARQELRSTNTPGAAIGIIQNSKLVWTKGLGLANVETQQPVDPEMLFRLGSTTKMFTAAAVVTLAEDGKLKLDEPIGNHISGLKTEIAALTPHQLLTHTAGLTDESTMSGRSDDEALAANARTIDSTWLFTEPGQIHSYSNPGYWLAGLVCEAVEGKPYADLMAARLFEPLGMTRTSLRPTQAMTWSLALGHEISAGKPRIVRPQADNAATRPAGQIYSSVPELARFVTAFMDDGRLGGRQVLSPTLIAHLTSPHVARPGNDEHYGYGMSVGKDRGVMIWQHGGSRTGYGSTIRMAPDQKTAVIILTNRSGSSLPKTAATALDMLLPLETAPPTQERKRQPLTEKQMAELAGIYTNNRQTIELAISDGNLVLRRGTSQASTPRAAFCWSGNNRLSLYSTIKDTPTTKEATATKNATTTKDTPATDDAAAASDSTTSSDATDSPRPTASFFIVRDSSGLPEYLVSGGRALKRKK